MPSTCRVISSLHSCISGTAELSNYWYAYSHAYNRRRFRKSYLISFVCEGETSIRAIGTTYFFQTSCDTTPDYLAYIGYNSTITFMRSDLSVSPAMHFRNLQYSNVLIRAKSPRFLSEKLLELIFYLLACLASLVVVDPFSYDL